MIKEAEINICQLIKKKKAGLKCMLPFLKLSQRIWEFTLFKLLQNTSATL